MKGAIQSDSCMANSLADQLGAGPRTKHLDTRYVWLQERVQDGDLSIKNVPSAKNCADVATKPVSTPSTTTALHNSAGFGILGDHGSHTPLQDVWRHLLEQARAGCAKQKIVGIGC